MKKIYIKFLELTYTDVNIIRPGYKPVSTKS